MIKKFKEFSKMLESTENSEPMKVAVLSVGVINIPSGKTKWDWNIYDSKMQAFLTSSRFLLLAEKDTFSVGDDFKLFDNDSSRSLGKSGKIIDSSPCEKEALIEMLYKNGYDYKPSRAWTKKEMKKKLDTSYSVKGIL